MSADALICSHPRSGGRWLRHLLAHYLSARHRLELEVTPETVFSIVPDHLDESPRGYPAYRYRNRRDIPIVAVCHQPYSWEFHRAYPIAFLARNPYDVAVSAFHHLTHQKGQFVGSMREFIQHPRLGLASWISYMNSWTPKLLLHRDAMFIPYRELDTEAETALARVLEFVDEKPDRRLVREAVAAAAELRRSRQIRTGQEGTFWDHLQPEEIFEIQEMLERDLSEISVHFLASIGVDVSPFPRETT